MMRIPFRRCTALFAAGGSIAATPAAFGNLIKAAIPQWRTVIRESGAQAD